MRQSGRQREWSWSAGFWAGPPESQILSLAMSGPVHSGFILEELVRFG